MMQIQPISILARAAAFEILSGSIYRCQPYTVFLGDTMVLRGDTNVFTLPNLLPGTEYTLRLRFPEEYSQILFTTPEETAFLSVKDFGAAGNGLTEDTAALQATVDACPAGGTVYLPPGTYLSYPLFLKSDMLLYLEKGATLLGGTEREKYPILPGMVRKENGEKSYATWEGNPLDSFASLLTLTEAHNVAIAGEGLVDGNAQNADWWLRPKEKRGAWRPRTIFAVRCEELTLMGIGVRNSPAWTIHPYYCRDVDLIGLRIENPPESPNTDGCNPECCENVRILGATISVGDDCISIKSGKYYMAQFHRQPSRNILIRNCHLRRGHGAVVMGSEISSGVYDVRVENCVFSDTDRGLRLKTRRGRGADSIVDGITLRNIRMEGVQTCFSINMFYFCDPDGHSDYVKCKEALPVDERTPTVGRLLCENIHCEQAEYAGGFFYGLPESPIQEITLRNVTVSFAKNAQPGLPVMMDDLEPTCRLALYAVNVRTLAMENVHFEGEAGKALHLVSGEELKYAER